jgi:hypothetical protein
VLTLPHSSLELGPITCLWSSAVPLFALSHVNGRVRTFENPLTNTCVIECLLTTYIHMVHGAWCMVHDVCTCYVTAKQFLRYKTHKQNCRKQSYLCNRQRRPIGLSDVDLIFPTQSAQDCCETVSLTHRPCSTPQKHLLLSVWYLFLSEAQ